MSLILHLVAADGDPWSTSWPDRSATNADATINTPEAAWWAVNLPQSEYGLTIATRMGGVGAVTCADNAAWDLADFTIVVRVQILGVNTYYPTYVAHETGGADGWAFYYSQAAGKSGFAAGGNLSVGNAWSLVTGQVYGLAMSMVASTKAIKFYRKVGTGAAATDGTATHASAVPANAATLNIGDGAFDPLDAHLQMRTLRIYDEVLDDSTILALMDTTDPADVAATVTPGGGGGTFAAPIGRGLIAR